MKKIVSIIFILFLCVFGLVGCQNSKVTYKDPATGEEKELKIEKTSDESEVADSLYAIALSETPVKEVSTTSTKMSFKIKLTQEEDENPETIDIKGSIEVNESFNKDANIRTTLDILKALSFNAKLELSGSVPNDEGKSQKFSKSTVEVFVEDTIAYAKINLDAKFAKYIASKDAKTGSIIQLINEKTIKLDLSTLIQNEELTEEQLADLNAILKGENQTTLREMLEEEGMSLAKEDLEYMVRTYGISITKVRGGKVTFSVDLAKQLYSADSESKMVMEVTVNVADTSLAGLSLKADIQEKYIKGTADISLEVSYKGKVAKISNSDKDDAIDANTLLGDYLK